MVLLLLPNVEQNLNGVQVLAFQLIGILDLKPGLDVLVLFPGHTEELLYLVCAQRGESPKELDYFGFSLQVPHKQ